MTSPISHIYHIYHIDIEALLYIYLLDSHRSHHIIYSNIYDISHIIVYQYDSDDAVSHPRHIYI